MVAADRLPPQLKRVAGGGKPRPHRRYGPVELRRYVPVHALSVHAGVPALHVAAERPPATTQSVASLFVVCRSCSPRIGAMQLVAPLEE